jgi:hypothetical protein
MAQAPRVDARGKWRNDCKEKCEIYAEGIEHAWVKDYVVPYLKEMYPESVDRLEKWIRRHGGVELSLGQIYSDPRTTVKGGLINVERSMWGIGSAVDGLAEDVNAGLTLEECRLGFARYLYYGDHFKQAHQAIDSVIAEYPAHTEAVVLRARIFVEEERCADARAIVDGVLAANENDKEALGVLLRILEKEKSWQEVASISARLVELYEHGCWRWVNACAGHAAALMELGDVEGFESDLKALLDTGLRFALRKVKQLRVRFGLETGDKATNKGA